MNLEFECESYIQIRPLQNYCSLAKDGLNMFALDVSQLASLSILQANSTSVERDVFMFIIEDLNTTDHDMLDPPNYSVARIWDPTLNFVELEERDGSSLVVDGAHLNHHHPAYLSVERRVHLIKIRHDVLS